MGGRLQIQNVFSKGGEALEIVLLKFSSKNSFKG